MPSPYLPNTDADREAMLKEIAPPSAAGTIAVEPALLPEKG